jgi:PAS domain S-box-containing protein
VKRRLDIQIKELIQRPAIEVNEDIYIAEVLQLFEESDNTSVIVLEKGVPTGIITYHDVVYHSAHWGDFLNMRTIDISSKPLIIISGNTPFYEAFWLMNEKGVRHIAIVEENRVIGVIDDRDILQTLTEVEFLSIKPVIDIMRAEIITTKIDTDISNAMRLMVENSVSSIVVEEDMKPIGILTEKDAVSLAKMGDLALQEPLEKYMHSPVITIHYKRSAIDAEKLMIKERIRRVVVVDDLGKIAGIVSQHDLMDGVSGVYVALLKQTIESLSSNLEKELKRSSFLSMNQHMVENLGHMVYFVNRDGEFVYANEKTKSILKYSKAEIENRCIWHVDSSIFKENWNSIWEYKKRVGNSISDSKFISKYGDEVEVQTNSSYVYYEGKEFLFGIAIDVREHKRKLQTLQENQKMSEIYLEISKTLFLIVDRKGEVLLVNRRISEILSLPKHEIIGKIWFDNFIPDFDKKSVRDSFWKLARKREVDGFEHFIKSSRGELRKIRWTYSCTYRDKKIERIILSGVDISEIREMEEKLRVSENKYHSLFRKSRANMLLIDAKTGEIVDANDKALEYYGYSLKEITDMNISEINTLSATEIFLEIEGAKQKERDHLYFKHRLKSGEIRDVEVHTGPIYHNHKNYLYSIIHDITERKNLEKRNDEYRKKLVEINRNLEKRVTEELAKRINKEIAYKNLFENAGDAFLVIRNGLFIDCNEEALNILGYKIKSDICGLSLVDISPKTQPDGETSSALFRKILKKALSRNSSVEFEWTIKRERLLNVKFTPIESDEEILIYAVWHDITETRALEIREKKQEKMLIQQSKLASMGEMMGAIAHQWRQPLNSIAIMLGNLEDLVEIDGSVSNELLLQTVENSMQKIESLSKTIDDFRHFFKPSKNREKFQTRQAVDEAIKVFSAQFYNCGIRIETDGDDFQIDGYRSDFLQVITNILSNSFDALQKSEKREVKISISDKTVSILDSGGGVSEDIIDRIFEPYFSTKEEGKGSGIGLYMSRSIIENMRGKIYAENRDSGLIVKIEF